MKFTYTKYWPPSTSWRLCHRFNYIVEYHCLIFLKIGIFMLINLFQNYIKLMFLICLYIFLTTVSYHDDFVHNLHCLVEHFRVFVIQGICLYRFVTTISCHVDFVLCFHCLVEHFRLFVIHDICPYRFPMAICHVDFVCNFHCLFSWIF